MSNAQLLASDRAAIVGVIDPDAYAANTYTTGWISAADFHSFMAIVKVGTLGTNATVDARIRQGTDDQGTGAKDVTGKAITQLTQAGADDSDKQAIINLYPEDLDVNNDFSHFQLSVTIAAAASDAGGLVLGMNKRHGKASDGDLASVVEIVA